jgi:hypothetical protein
MRPMLLTIGVVLLAAAPACAGGKTTPENKAASEALALLDRFVGEWTVDGKWSSGEELHARTIYEWRLGKKIMMTRTYVMDKGKEYQRYEGIFAWRPELKLLYQVSFSFDGSMTEVVVEPEGEASLKIGFTPFAPDRESKVRQVIRLVDNNRFQWTVLLKTGDKWEQLIDATWKRKVP